MVGADFALDLALAEKRPPLVRPSKSTALIVALLRASTLAAWPWSPVSTFVRTFLHESGYADQLHLAADDVNNVDVGGSAY